MSVDLTTALAVPFAHLQDATYDLRMVFASGSPTTVHILLPTGSYRHHLAPTSGAVTDSLRALKAAADTALAARGASESVTVSISDRGRVTIALSSGTCTWTLKASVAALFGFASASFSGVGSIAGTHLPRHFYTFVGGDSQGARPKTRNAARATMDGRVIGVRSGVFYRTDTLALQFLPATPTLAASADEPADWSCWEPDAGGGTAVPWTCAEMLVTALGQTCAFTRDWPSVRSSTSVAYDLVSISPESLTEPEVDQQFPSLATWRAWRLGVLYQADATTPHLPSRATRA